MSKQRTDKRSRKLDLKQIVKSQTEKNTIPPKQEREFIRPPQPLQKKVAN